MLTDRWIYSTVCHTVHQGAQLYCTSKHFSGLLMFIKSLLFAVHPLKVNAENPRGKIVP